MFKKICIFICFLAILGCGQGNETPKLTLPVIKRDPGSECLTFERYLPLPDLNNGKTFYEYRVPSSGDFIDTKMEITVNSDDGTSLSEKDILIRTEFNTVSNLPNLAPSETPSYFPDLVWPWASGTFISEDVNASSYVYFYGDDGAKRMVTNTDGFVYSEYYDNAWVLGKTLFPPLEIGSNKEYDIKHYDPNNSSIYWDETTVFNVLGKKIIYTEMGCIETIKISTVSVSKSKFENELFDLLLSDEQATVASIRTDYVHPILHIVMSEEFVESYTTDPSSPLNTIESKRVISNSNIQNLPLKVSPN